MVGVLLVLSAIVCISHLLWRVLTTKRGAAFLDESPEVCKPALPAAAEHILSRLQMSHERRRVLSAATAHFLVEAKSKAAARLWCCKLAGVAELTQCVSNLVLADPERFLVKAR
jgi:hypothetical protein